MLVINKLDLMVRLLYLRAQISNIYYAKNIFQNYKKRLSLVYLEQTTSYNRKMNLRFIKLNFLDIIAYIIYFIRHSNLTSLSTKPRLQQVQHVLI